MDATDNTDNVLDTIKAIKLLELLPSIIYDILQKEFHWVTFVDGQILTYQILNGEEIKVDDFKMKTKSFIAWNLGKIYTKDGTFYIRPEVVNSLRTKILDFLDKNR